MAAKLLIPVVPRLHHDVADPQIVRLLEQECSGSIAVVITSDSIVSTEPFVLDIT